MFFFTHCCFYFHSTNWYRQNFLCHVNSPIDADDDLPKLLQFLVKTAVYLKALSGPKIGYSINAVGKIEQILAEK